MWIGEIFRSAFSCKTLSAAILIRKGVPFSHEKQSLIKRVVIEENLQISDISQTNLIIGRDFNTVIDVHLDRSFTRNPPKKFQEIFLKKSFFKRLDSLITPSLWEHKTPK